MKQSQIVLMKNTHKYVRRDNVDHKISCAVDKENAFMKKGLFTNMTKIQRKANS